MKKGRYILMKKGRYILMKKGRYILVKKGLYISMVFLLNQISSVGRICGCFIKKVVIFCMVRLFARIRYLSTSTR